MRVGILLSQPANQSLGTDNRVSGILKGLDSLGVETLVLVQGEVKNGRPGLNPLDLRRTRQPSGLTQRFARRFLASPALGNAIFWSPLLLRRQIGLLAKGVISLNPDVDVLQGEQQLASMAVVEAGRALGLPAVADLHAIWSEELVALGSTQRGGRADRNIRALESAIVAGADHVSVVRLPRCDQTPVGSSSRECSPPYRTSNYSSKRCRLFVGGCLTSSSISRARASLPARSGSNVKRWACVRGFSGFKIRSASLSSSRRVTSASCRRTVTGAGRWLIQRNSTPTCQLAYPLLQTGSARGPIWWKTKELALLRIALRRASRMGSSNSLKTRVEVNGVVNALWL